MNIINNFLWHLSWDNYSAIFATRVKAENYIKNMACKIEAIIKEKEYTDDYTIYEVEYNNGYKGSFYLELLEVIDN